MSEENAAQPLLGIDSDGKIAFDFGVFGLPETFIINKDGSIFFGSIKKVRSINFILNRSKLLEILIKI